MRKYDLTPAAFARYLAYDAQVVHGNMECAMAWLAESWRLWDRISDLHFDHTGLAYYTNPDQEMQQRYNGMGWAGYPASHYDQFIMETDLYLIALEYNMGEYLGVNLYTGEPFTDDMRTLEVAS